MKTTVPLKASHLFAIAAIFVGASFAWLILSQLVAYRTSESENALQQDVKGNWGPVMRQLHPRITYESPTSKKAVRELQPAASDIQVALHYNRKKKGLLWYRTYDVDFTAKYDVVNSTPIRQTLYLEFQLPADGASYENFKLQVGENPPTQRTPSDGKITDTVLLAPGASTPVTVAYRSRGMNEWRYEFGKNRRIRNFNLSLETNFTEIDFPAGTGSPTQSQQFKDGGATMGWNYPDVIDGNSIGMAMPSVLNPGPTVERITLFAPVSLLFFFSVVVIVGMAKGVNLHPMNYFFLAAGFFAFQLLMAYLVDVIALFPAFLVACVVSLLLVGGYVFAVAGPKFTVVVAAAQFTYMALFSYSFFFEGLSGLTITIGAILTLALLMMLTARLDWSQVFNAARRPVTTATTPPPVPNLG